MADNAGESDPEKHSRSSHESDLDHFPMDIIYDKSGSIHSQSHDDVNTNGGGSQNVVHFPADNTSLSSAKEKDNEQNFIPTSLKNDNTVYHTNQNIIQDDMAFSDESETEDHSHNKSHSKCGCCFTCRTRCLACCRPCMTKFNPLPENPSRCQKIRYAFFCPPHGKVAKLLTSLLALIFFYGALWGIIGADALPGGNIFAILMVFIFCMIGGMLIEKIKLPPLLGMLLVGGLLNNVPKINVAKDIDENWSSSLRSIALVVILTRAGLGLDPKALMKLSFGVIRLAFLPCLIESITAAITSHFILGFDWIWGFMLGFVLSAVSPAVVVPSMLGLTERGYGVDQGIPTLVIAASSIDDVIAITGFGVALGMAFSTGNIVKTIFSGLAEASVGVLYGIIFGVIIWFLPHMKHTSKTAFRFIMLFSAGLLALFCSRRVNHPGAGALGCLSVAFVAGLKWRKDVAPGQNMLLEKLFAGLWVVFQPLLFGLIGAEIKISGIDARTTGLGVAILCIGLSIRMLVSFLAVFGLGLNMKEKLFIPLAWLPKATVQAAIGSVALDTARQMSPPNPYDIYLGKQVLTIAVLVILITAPIGAAAIALAGPKLLQKHVEPAYELKTQKMPAENAEEGKPGSVEEPDSTVVYVL